MALRSPRLVAGSLGGGDLGGIAAQITIVRSTGTSPVAAVELAESAKTFPDRLRLGLGALRAIALRSPRWWRGRSGDSLCILSNYVPLALFAYFAILCAPTGLNSIA
jgi:hypothetical protein